MRAKAKVSSACESSRSAFTLLEVILAMAIFFMAVVVVVSAYLNTLRVMASVQVNQSLEQDMSIIREHALLVADVEEVEKGGEVVTGEHGLATWQIEYEPTEIADLFLVTLRVELDPIDEENGIREAEQNFYLMRPTWSDPLDRDELRARSRERLVERQLSMSQ